jgi:DNA-binding beta-propeller fold protein YncE
MLIAALVPAVAGQQGADAATAGTSTGPTVLGTFGSSGTGPGQYTFPVSIAAAPDGTLLIGDYEQNRIQRVSSTGTYMASYGSAGSGNGQFNIPADIAVAPDGGFYVADAANHRVQRFTSSGAFVTSWGSLGTGPGQFNSPTAVELDADGNVWVADVADRLQKFSPSGTRLAGLGVSGTAAGQLNDPSGITILPGGNLAVSDRGNNRVQVFTTSGALVTGWGSFGSEAGQFRNPAGLDSGPDGEVYATDPDNNRIQAFSSSGVHRWTYGVATNSSPLADPRDVVRVGSTLYVLDSGNQRVVRMALTLAPTAPPPTAIGSFGTAGSGPGQLNGPNGVVGAPDGTILVADTYNHRIQRFRSDGTYLSMFGSNGSGPGQFKSPIALATGADGTIYVADHENHRVQRFDAAGNYLNSWGTLGSSPGQFVFPSAIDLDADGNVWVTDFGTDSAQKFSPTGTLLGHVGGPGSAAGQFNDPYGVTVLPDGNLSLTERGNNRAQVLTPTGTPVLRWGSFGTETGQFRSPAGTDSGPDGETYIADSDNHRIQAFSNAVHQWTYGSFGSGPSNLNTPRGVARVGGALYIADAGNNRIVVTGLAVPPTASLTVSPSSGQAPVEVMADASGSRPGGALISSYRFDFGDGSTPTTGAAATAPHTYSTAGDYTVTVTVTDAAARTATATAGVTITAPPPPPPPDTDPEGEPGAIVLSSGGDLHLHPTGDPAVWQQLTSGPEEDSKPSWDETGTRIVFIRDSAVWVVNADGSGLRQVSPAGTFNADPDIFGNRVVFTRLNTPAAMMAVDLATGVLTELRRGASVPVGAVFSPTGHRILFSQAGALMTMAPDGTGVRTLLPSSVGASSPGWSPDGSEVAFASRDASNIPYITTANSDGSNVRRVGSGNGIIGGFPAFSPDGSKLVIGGSDPTVQVIDRAAGTSTVFSYNSLTPDWFSPPTGKPPVTLVVTTTTTTGDGGTVIDDGCHPAPGDCTLDEAIDDGNQADPDDDVVIDLPDGGVIKPTRPLPEITRPITLIGRGTIDDVYPGGRVTDGTEGTGVGGDVDSDACSRDLTILDGTDAGNGTHGLRIRTGRSATRATRVHGLGIVNFDGDGVRVASSARPRPRRVRRRRGHRAAAGRDRGPRHHAAWGVEAQPHHRRRHHGRHQGGRGHVLRRLQGDRCVGAGVARGAHPVHCRAPRPPPSDRPAAQDVARHRALGAGQPGVLLG